MIHPNNYPTIIDGPGDYITRNHKRVTIHEVKEQKDNTCMEFRAKGSIWKSNDKMGNNPEYGIWHVSGVSRAVGIYGKDIVGKWKSS